MTYNTQYFLNQLNNIKSQALGIKSRISQLAQSEGGTVVPPPAPPKPVAPVASPQTSSAGATTYSVPKNNIGLNTGASIVDYLKSAGQASDFGSRSGLAQQYGIQNYGGSAEQNTRLLDLLRGGIKSAGVSNASPSPSNPVWKPGQPITTVEQATAAGNAARIAAQKAGVNPISGAPITPAAASPNAPSTPTPETPALTGENTQDVVQGYINKYLQPIDYAALAKQAEEIAQKTYQPIETKLQDIITNIKATYKQAQDDLLENQQKQIEELKGSYAIRGLTDSGAYQKASQDLQKKHIQEVNDLTQKEQQDITNISYEVAARKPEAINNILSLMNSEMQNTQARASTLLGALLTNQLAEGRGEKTARTVTVTDKDGNKYVVLLDANGNEINRIYAGKGTSKGTSKGTEMQNYLYNQGLPLTTATSTGKLTTSALDKIISAKVPLDIANGIWLNMQQGLTFQEIRQGMEQEGLDIKYLDKFVQALQGTSGGFQ